MDTPFKIPPHLNDENTHRQKFLNDDFGGCERYEQCVGVGGVSSESVSDVSFEWVWVLCMSGVYTCLM